jgi:hypothetical protein
VSVRDHHAALPDPFDHHHRHRPLEDWGKLIADVPAATAILDRFLHNADAISTTGRSYRMSSRSAKPTGAAGEKSGKSCQEDEK